MTKERLIVVINHKVEGLFCLKLFLTCYSINCDIFFQMSAKAKEDVKLFLENEKAVSKANDEKLDDEKVVEEKMQTYRALWNKRDASSKGKK